MHLRSSPKPPMVPRECSFITAFVFNPLLFWADVVKRRWGRGYLCGVSLSCTTTVGFQQVSDIGPLQHACFGRRVRPYASVQTCPWWDISVSVSINDYDLRLLAVNVFHKRLFFINVWIKMFTAFIVVYRFLRSHENKRLLTVNVFDKRFP